MEEDQIKKILQDEIENIEAPEILKLKVLQSVGVLETVRSFMEFYASIPDSLTRKVRDERHVIT